MYEVSLINLRWGLPYRGEGFPFPTKRNYDLVSTFTSDSHS